MEEEQGRHRKANETLGAIAETAAKFGMVFTEG